MKVSVTEQEMNVVCESLKNYFSKANVDYGKLGYPTIWKLRANVIELIQKFEPEEGD